MPRKKVDPEFSGEITENMFRVWLVASLESQVNLRKRIATLMFSEDVRSRSEGLSVFNAPALIVTKGIADEIVGGSK